MMQDAEKIEKIQVALARLEEQFWASEKALVTQAVEYERRLQTLNHAHEKELSVQQTYVTQEKFEDREAAQDTARLLALDHVDEKVAETDKALRDQIGGVSSSLQQIRETYLDREYYYREHKALEDRLSASVNASVRQDLYESNVKEWAAWRERVNGDLAAREGEASAKQAIATRNQWIIGVVVIFVVVFLQAVVGGNIHL